MTKSIAYLDHNATTPVLPAVRDAMMGALLLEGNPSSVHSAGRKARAAMETAREQVAKVLNVPSSWVIFTSGGTEADALALNGSGCQRILASAVEHAAVLEHDQVDIIPVDENGVVDLKKLSDLLGETDVSTLVSVMAVNNETGVIQPIEDIVRLAHKHGAVVHCDAVQALGKISLDVRALELDFVSVSAHKIGGPKGIGALIKRDGIGFTASQKGGGQEQSLRGGTENLPGIIGFGAAAELLRDKVDVTALRDYMEDKIAALSDKIVIFGKDAKRVGNTSCFAYPGITSERQVMAMDLAGIMVSAGSACSSGKVKASHVLEAMGVAPELSTCCLRVSLGGQTTKEEIDVFLSEWTKMVARVEKRLNERGNAA